MIEADDLDGKRPTEAGKTAAEREGDGEDAIDIDAEAARHALVVDRRAHLRAEAGVFERRDQEERDQQRNADQEQPVYADALAHDRDRAAQIRGHVQGLLNGSVDIGGDGDRDENDPDRQQALVEISGTVEATIKQALERHACHRRGYKCHRQADQKRPTEVVRHRHGDVAAQHGEAAVRQVDEVHHAERDRQADRQEEQQHPIGKAVEQHAEGRGDHAGVRAVVSMSTRLVSRFRSSPAAAAPSDANFGIKGTPATL